MKKLLWIALILSLIVARMHAREYPPLPVSPNRPPVDRPVPGEKPLFLTWNVTSGTRDVLEFSADMLTWADLPGPYQVLDFEGAASYWVPVPRGYAKAFFRVRRDWGNPWVN